MSGMAAASRTGQGGVRMSQGVTAAVLCRRNPARLAAGEDTTVLRRGWRKPCVAMAANHPIQPAMTILVSIRIQYQLMSRRRDVLCLGALGALAASGAGAKLPNVTLGMEKAKVTREPFGDLRIYFDGPTDQLRAMTAGSLRLNAGMTPHPPHQHPEEEFMVITEGTGELSMDGKITKVGPGAMMYCAGGRLHGIVNTGKTPLLFYFYKWQA
jgi:mannose-6-phosphate isomerase-like protein (cupin superfamily)